MLPGNPFLKGFSQTPNGTIFDSARVEQLRKGPLVDLADVDAASALSRLIWDELLDYGTEQKNLRLDNVEIAVALRALRAVLGRLRIVPSSARLRARRPQEHTVHGERSSRLPIRPAPCPAAANSKP
ncbi:hypothetical protein [Nonomuraea sp. NPDC048916]|uniref:hypothetical protein n=1 Tax=Nonomuraea sp. NPDC048916 TaxID=3154232 RepID=UPI0033E90890